MMKYLSLLLLIGLISGQEYDPETGEILEKLYNLDVSFLRYLLTKTASILLNNRENNCFFLKAFSSCNLLCNQRIFLFVLI